MNGSKSEFVNLLDDAKTFREDRVARFALKHYGVMTLDLIGQFMGVSRERVRQIENEALKKLRRAASRGDKAAAEALASLRERLETPEPESAWDRAYREAPGEIILRPWLAATAGKFRSRISPKPTLGRLHEYQGKHYTIGQLCEMYGLSYPTVRERLKHGIPLDAPKRSVGKKRAA
jgi:hypothetical protein